MQLRGMFTLSRTSVGIIAIVAIIAGVVGFKDVLAGHGVYLAQLDDVNHAKEENSFRVNWVFRYWADGNVLLWKAVNSTGTGPASDDYRDDVMEAILMWTNALPFRFQETSSTSDANVLFVEAACPSGAVGCSLQPGDTEWLGDAFRSGSYWTKTKVYVNPTRSIYEYSVSPPQSCAVNLERCFPRIAAISHEIGHLVGLAERYFDVPPTPPGQFVCNSNEDVIMDSMKRGASNFLVHCDQKHWPTSSDVDRARDFWESQPDEWLPSAATKEEHRGLFTFTDQAWSEWERQVQYLYLEGSNWTPFYTETYTSNIGGHAWYEFDIRERVVDRDDFTPAPPGSRWYTMCATPKFFGLNQSGTLGAGPCAPVVWLE